MTQTLIKMPKTARAGEVIEIATTIAHVMDSGYKPGADGKLIPRNILRSFTCQYDGCRCLKRSCFRRFLLTRL